VARELGISVEYLLTGEIYKKETLTDDERELLIYRSFRTDSRKVRVRRHIQQLLDDAREDGEATGLRGRDGVDSGSVFRYSLIKRRKRLGRG
jgi:hypothetical protein